MESKILNFPDAMRLAQIVSKYLDTESIKKMTGEEFAYDIFGSMEVEEILEISRLLDISTSDTSNPNEIIIGCIQGMIKNNLLDLLSSYEKIGFSK